MDIKTPLDCYIKKKQNPEVKSSEELTNLTSFELEREFGKLHTELQFLRSENQKLYQGNSEAGKGIRGRILKFMGIKLRTQPPPPKIKKSLIKTILNNVIFFVSSMAFFTWAGISATHLDNLNLAFVGVSTLFISLLATVLCPKSRNDLIRVLRFLGDIGAVALAQTTLNGMGMGSLHTAIFLALMYALATRRLIRDL